MTSDLPTFSLPSDLLPGDGRFGSGPSKVRVEALIELAATGSEYLGTSHRRDGVKSVVRRIRSGLTELFGLVDGVEVVLGLGGATAFWDVAAYSLIEHRSLHLVFGEFSAKFAAAVARAPHLDEPFIIESAAGTRPATGLRAGADAYAFPHCETSTGVMMPVVRPDGFDGVVIVDATSAAGAAPLDLAACDAYYFSPQKAFGAEGGLWTALLSPSAIDRAEQIHAAGRQVPPFLDLHRAIAESRRDQTYNTPALATLHFFARQIEWMLEQGGLSWAAERSAESARHVYEWAAASEYATPFVADPAHRSTTVTVIDLKPPVNASVVSQILRANGIVDTEGYRKLGRNQLRFGVFPAVAPDDVTKLTAAVDYIVERL
jgi:phosphoserine aminotransferase